MAFLFVLPEKKGEKGVKKRDFFCISLIMMHYEVHIYYKFYRQKLCFFSTRIVYNFYRQKLYPGTKKPKAFAYNHQQCIFVSPAQSPLKFDNVVKSRALNKKGRVAQWIRH